MSPSLSAPILLVEDERHLREAVTRLLVSEGHEVVSAATGEEALLLASRLPEIALLVTDIRLPDMYGRRLAGRLIEARAESWPAPPVLYMSGHPAEMALETPLTGSERFLQKPFEFADFLALVRQLLERSPSPGRER